jgi:hypothetical protein
MTIGISRFARKGAPTQGAEEKQKTKEPQSHPTATSNYDGGFEMGDNFGYSEGMGNDGGGFDDGFLAEGKDINNYEENFGENYDGTEEYKIDREYEDIAMVGGTEVRFATETTRGNAPFASRH